MRIFTIIISILLSNYCNAEIVILDGKEVEYSIRKVTHNQDLDKLSIDIQVELVKGQLPTENEIAAISRSVLKEQPKAERTWVLYFLPEMPSDAGAFATDHRATEPEGVKILPYMLYNTPYQSLAE